MVQLVFSSQMRYVANNKGELVVIGRSCEVVIHDDIGRERERHKVPYGAILMVQDGEAIKAGQTLATWGSAYPSDDYRHAGWVKFENVEEGVTVAKQTDDVTGLSTLVVIDGKRRSSSASNCCVRLSNCWMKMVWKFAFLVRLPQFLWHSRSVR